MFPGLDGGFQVDRSSGVERRWKFRIAKDCVSREWAERLNSRENKKNNHLAMGDTGKRVCKAKTKSVEQECMDIGVKVMIEVEETKKSLPCINGEPKS